MPNEKPNTTEDIIICRNVEKWFDDFHVLRGVNLTIKKGEVVVVCGPSGGGKSTFIRTINRLEEHQRGDIIVDGVELTSDLRNIHAIRRDIGMVFQSFNLFPHLKVIDNVTLAPIWVRKWPKEKAVKVAMELLERVGIPEQADKYPGQLSGGQQQRVAIARALAMVELARSGMTMIVVTHEMGFAKEVAHRIIFFAEGNIVEQNTTEEFFENPREERTKLFLSQILTH
jgi:general L-amino acid transport system ATP-binding protein